MESLKETFFEDPFYLYVLLILGGVVLAGVWRSRKQAKWVLGILLLTVLAAGIYVLERVVVTDREQIRLALDDIARSVERHEIDRAASHLDEKYLGWGGLRPAAILAAKAAVKAYNIREVRFLGERRVTVAGRYADCTAITIVRFGGAQQTGSRATLGWKVEWVKRPDGWKIRRANPTREVIP